MHFGIGKFKFPRQTSPSYLKSSARASFTLIELLVVIAIVAVLSVVVILTLNPAELLKQTRDSTRLSDLTIINKSIGLYLADRPQDALGVASTTYVSIPDPTATTTSGTNCAGIGLSTSSLPSGWSYHCAASSTLKNTNGTGWIPINFSQISSGPPLERLPIDPLNTSSTGNYYTYTMGGSWELTTALEAQKHKLGGASDKISTDGGDAMGLYETGTNKTLTPIDYGDPSLMGWWNFEEGAGTTTSTDRSGKNKNGSWYGSGTHHATGKVGAYAGQFDGSTDYISTPETTYNTITACAWVSSDNPTGLSNIFGGTGILNYPSVTGSRFQIYDGAGWRSATTPILPGAWYHFCMTFDGPTKSLTIYTNGNSEYSAAGLGTYTNAMPSMVARYWSPAIRLLGGKLDDIRIYNRVLTTAEVTAIYNATK